MVTATTEIYTYLHTLSLHDALPISTCRAATRCTRTSSTASTRWSPACRSRSTCWSRKSARWPSTWSSRRTEERRWGIRHRRVPAITNPESRIPNPGVKHERPSEPVQPAAPGARLRRDQDRAGLAGPDPLVVVRRSQEARDHQLPRSEEHTYEHQSIMRTTYAVFCLKKNT